MWKIILIIFLLLSSFFPGQLHAQDQDSETLEGKIIEVVDDQKQLDGNGNEYIYQKLLVDISRGSLSGETIEIENNAVSIMNPVSYEKGDEVVIMHVQSPSGDLFYIIDFVRRDGLFVLFLIFVVLAIVIGRWSGAASLVGMAISFAVIFAFILPRIMDGMNPVLAAIVGSMGIVPVTFYLSHGFNPKTHLAIIGTLITLVMSGILAYFFIEITSLTGFATEEASFLGFEMSGLNMKGILLAGIIIGLLGVLDDITVSQAAIVKELKYTDNKLKSKQLFAKSMNIGRDHIASLINTLVLVYTGASLPLLLLFIKTPSPFSELINLELIADEVVRTLVGSIGLILAVPITSFIASKYYENKSK